MNDLISVLALPATWVGSEPSRIAGSLLDGLLSMLNLDFVYVRLGCSGGEVSELLRISSAWEVMPQPQEVGEMVRSWLGDSTQSWPELTRKTFKHRDVSMMPLQLGLQGEIGALVAGSERIDFPQQLERLVLSVAANQATVGLREAWLLNEQERTASRGLAAANQRLKKSEAALHGALDKIKKSEGKLRQVIDTIPTLAWCNLPDGPNEFLNRGWHEYTGLSPEESHGWGWQSAFHPDDLPALLEKWGKMLVSGKSDEIEARLRRHDGVYRWFLIRAQAFRDETGAIVRWYGTSTDNEDRKRAEEALVASERNLRLIINTMPVLAWSAQADGSVDFMNQRWLDYTGLSPVQAQGWGWSQAFHPDDLGRLNDYWLTTIASGQTGEIEARLRRFDGRYRWFLFRASPLRDESGAVVRWYGTNTDIDDRKRAEEELRVRELNLLQITETIPEMLWSATPEGAFDYCNGRLLAYTGFSGEDVKGDAWKKLLHPDDADRAAQLWMNCTRTRAPFRVEVRTIHAADKSYRWCVANALPLLDGEGRTIKWHGTVVDMHDWRLAQEELRNAQSELARVMRVMTMGQLTASIAHEVNQPLSGIITNANTCLRMLDTNPPNVEGARETVRRTIRDGHRASDVITRLRTLYSNKEPAVESMDLNEATREVAALSLSDIQIRGVMLRYELAADLPTVVGDRIQLQQVILNLVRNAVDAMSTIDDHPRELLIRTERDAGNQVRVSIKDSGVGFTSQATDKIFDAFYTTKPEGMGMGLSISRSIIEAHQGRLWVTPNDGPGSTFSFSIPCTLGGLADSEVRVRRTNPSTDAD
ncbi:MAG: PAS domain-containing protein [Candidatus Acidiferrales bacterium]